MGIEIAYDKATHRRKMLDILKYFDAYCRKHDLKYSLGYGSLLGAVRHKGMIPWDDDIDVIMPRPDYQRFLELSEKDFDDNYKVLNQYNTKNYYLSFSKVVDKNTCLIELKEHRDCPIGVFIDIFPMDGLSPRKEDLDEQKRLIGHYAYQAKYILFGNIDWIHNIKRLFYKYFIGINNLMVKIDKVASRYDFDSATHIKDFTDKDHSTELPKSIFDELIELDFDGLKMMCLKRYHECLKFWYDDYMWIPTIEIQNQLRHHQYFIDLERSYTNKELKVKNII